MSLAFAAASRSQSKFEKYSKEMIDMLNSEIVTKSAPLHFYQVKSVLQTRALIQSDESERSNKFIEKGIQPKPQPVLIVAPTASGKSGMIVLLPYVLNAKRVLILTPSKVISEQLGVAFGSSQQKKCFFESIGMLKDISDDKREDMLESLLEPVKIIQGANDIKERFGKLVIVNAQKFGGQSKLSLVYQDEAIVKDVQTFFKKFDLLIVDEAHHYPAKTWNNIIKAFVGKPVNGVRERKNIIFLTATPYKNIKGKLQFILGPGKDAQKRIAYEITRDTLKGISTRNCRFVEPPHSATPKAVYKDLWKLFKDNYKKESRFFHQAMILMRTKKEAHQLVAELNELARKPDFAVALLAEAPKALEVFTNGKARIGITCGVGLEGYDNPNVTICVILRNIVRGTILFNQFIGRCMRLRRGLGGSPDRSEGIILSYSKYAQRTLWEQFEKSVADDDPIEVDDLED